MILSGFSLDGYEFIPYYLNIFSNSIQIPQVNLIDDKYSDYVSCDIDDIEYRLHPKIAQEYKIPKIASADLKQKKLLYTSDLEIRVLQILGFNHSKSRIQGTDYVKHIKLYDGTIAIEPTWTTFSSLCIANKREVFFKENKERYGSLITLTGNKKSVLYKHRFALYNKRIPQSKKNPDKYLGFPRNIAENINRFNNKAVGLNQHSNTRTVMFDIDNHNYNSVEDGIIAANRALNLLIKELDYPHIAMVERSFTGSYHLAIMTNYFIRDEHMINYLKDFNIRHNTNIETRLTTKLFRIPGHFTYELGDLNIKENGDVEFIPFPIENAYEMYITKVIEAENSDFRLDYSIFEPSFKHTQYANTGSNIYRRNKTKSNRYNVSGERPGDKFPLTRGNRNINTIKIARFMRATGATFDKFYAELNYANSGSRDWSAWSSKEKVDAAQRAWDNAAKGLSESTNTYNSDKFISSKEFVPLNILNMLSNDKLIEALAPIKPASKPANRNRLIADTRICLIEIIGRILYECTNSREIYGVSEEDMHKYAAGFQFPRLMQDRLKNALHIKSNVRLIFRSLLNNKLLFEQYFHCPMGYKYKTHRNDTSHCKQFYPVGVNPDCKDQGVIIASIESSLHAILENGNRSTTHIEAEAQSYIYMCQLSFIDNFTLWSESFINWFFEYDKRLPQIYTSHL